jgi:hypothetical protein
LRERLVREAHPTLALAARKALGDACGTLKWMADYSCSYTKTGVCEENRSIWAQRLQELHDTAAAFIAPHARVE